MALVMTAPAGAEPGAEPITPYAMGRTGYGVEISGVTSYGTTWLGPVIGTADAEVTGWYSWCITVGYDAPQGAGASSIDYVSDPELAWIMGAKEPEARADASGISAAAISYGAHMRHETGTGSVSADARKAALEANTPQSIKDKWAGYLAEATAHAGPYSAGNPTVEGEGKRTGVIHNLGVQSDAGTWIPGVNMTVTLAGPAVFASTGTQTWRPRSCGTRPRSPARCRSATRSTG